MQYVLDNVKRYITTVEFQNTSSIVGVERLRSFREEGLIGTFTKKEFCYSFDNIIWSSWQTFTNANLTAIDFEDESNFYIHIKYTRSSVNSGNINAIYLTFDSPAISVAGSDSSIINADLLQGQDGLYYLDRAHHFGIDPSEMYLYAWQLTQDASIYAIANNLTGTNSSTFQLNKDSSGVILKDVSGNLVIVTSDGSTYANITANYINVTSAKIDTLTGPLYAQDGSVVIIPSTKLLLCYKTEFRGNGFIDTFAITHDLSTLNHTTTIWQRDIQEEVFTDIIRGSNEDTILFSTAPTAGVWHDVIIMGFSES